MCVAQVRQPGTATVEAFCIDLIRTALVHLQHACVCHRSASRVLRIADPINWFLGHMCARARRSTTVSRSNF